MRGRLAFHVQNGKRLTVARQAYIQAASLDFPRTQQVASFDVCDALVFLFRGTNHRDSFAAVSQAVKCCLLFSLWPRSFAARGVR